VQPNYYPKTTDGSSGGSLNVTSEGNANRYSDREPLTSFFPQGLIQRMSSDLKREFEADDLFQSFLFVKMNSLTASKNRIQRLEE